MTIDSWLKKVGYTGAQNGGLCTIYPDDVERLKQHLAAAERFNDACAAVNTLAELIQFCNIHSNTVPLVQVVRLKDRALSVMHDAYSMLKEFDR